MSKKKLGIIALEIENFIINNKSNGWAKQTENPFCFLRFDSEKKQILVCKWGNKRRPPNTNNIYWKRIEIKSSHGTTQSWVEILDTLKLWDKIWADIVFNPFQSDSVPDLFPNSRLSVPCIQTRNKNLFSIGA